MAVFDCPEKTKNIRCHIADCRNLDIQTHDYIPLQFYKRYSALSRYAAERSGNYKFLKTQIRF